MTRPEPPSDDRAPAPPDARPPRRRRYSGTHPRRFDEKYKERDAARHPQTVAKVLASGKTPAGSHRPIMVREVLEALAPAPGEVAVDATLGGGGHATELARRVQPGGRLIGLDVDPLELPRAEQRLRAAGFGPETFVAVQANHASLPKVLAAQGLETADMVLADLGCSSMQLDDPARGFSHKHDGPLDLRMNPQRGESAAALLARCDAAELQALLRDASDEPRAAPIAAALVAARARAPLATTRALAQAIDAGLPRGAEDATRRDTRARVFQALRIAVNDELATLEAFLRALPWCLSSGGRAAILSFHSGEDRRVKQALREGLRSGLYEEISESVIRPSPEETRDNPRARSAKLRWARRA